MDKYRDYSLQKTKEYNVTAWCFLCYGTGTIRKRAHDIVPRITFEGCKKCKNFRRLWYKEGSPLHKQADRIIKGLTPGIRKHNNDRGMFRR